MAETANRTHRTEMRLLPEQKSRIERAAQIKGMSLSDFVVLNADAAARKTIEEETSWTLSNRDRDAFVKALLHPREPNETMKAAASRYKEWAAGK